MIILDMDMPKNCGECPLKDHDDCSEWCCFGEWDEFDRRDIRSVTCPIIAEVKVVMGDEGYIETRTDKS